MEILIAIESVNSKFGEIVTERNETTCLRVMHRQAKQSKFTLVRLLHIVRNDTIYLPPPFSSLPRWGGKVKGYFSLSSSPLITSFFCHAGPCAELDSVLIQHLIPDPEIDLS